VSAARIGEVHLLVPGPFDQKTGGYLYDRRIVEGLRARGNTVQVHELPGSYPLVDEDAILSADRIMARLPDRALVVIDGLGFPGVAGGLWMESHRLRLVGLVHHPLCYETGLTPAEAETLRVLEQGCLARVRRTIATSPFTAGVLREFGIAPERLGVVEPGMPKPPGPAVGSDDGVPNLLCIATVTPRKGHAVLIKALAMLRDLPWRFINVGGLTRDPPTTAAVRAATERHGLGDRVALHDEVAPEDVAAFYRSADLFVFPSLYEGYGMALGEAMTWGLPIVTTTAGAIPVTVPRDAALFVPPGDAAALAEALRRMLTVPELRRAVAAGSNAAGAALPTWDQSIDRFAAELEHLVPKRL